jgi:hypothetical protein
MVYQAARKDDELLLVNGHSDVLVDSVDVKSRLVGTEMDWDKTWDRLVL